MMSLDAFAQVNPALGAATLHWLCDGYCLVENRSPDGLSLPWAMLSLVLLAPDRVRDALPKASSAKLAVMMNTNPTWRALAAEAIRGSAWIFWEALRLGVTLDVVRLEDARIHVGRPIGKPRTEFEKDVRRRSRALGQVIAKERDDVSRAMLFGVGIRP